jgi:hypothetical protein
MSSVFSIASTGRRVSLLPRIASLRPTRSLPHELVLPTGRRLGVLALAIAIRKYRIDPHNREPLHAKRRSSRTGASHFAGTFAPRHPYAVCSRQRRTSTKCGQGAGALGAPHPGDVDPEGRGWIASRPWPLVVHHRTLVLASDETSSKPGSSPVARVGEPGPGRLGLDAGWASALAMFL